MIRLEGTDEEGERERLKWAHLEPRSPDPQYPSRLRSCLKVRVKAETNAKAIPIELSTKRSGEA